MVRSRTETIDRRAAAERLVGKGWATSLMMTSQRVARLGQPVEAPPQEAVDDHDVDGHHCDAAQQSCMIGRVLNDVGAEPVGRQRRVVVVDAFQAPPAAVIPPVT